MVQQRHDDGYGLVIRAEKNDIWDRITGSEAFRLEEKLLDEVQYRTYHNRIEKLASLPYLDYYAEDLLWVECLKKKKTLQAK